jgi:hypothetical protein
MEKAPPVVLHLRLQLGDRGAAIAHDDVMALGSHFCERTQAIGRGYLHSPLDWNCTQWPELTKRPPDTHKGTNKEHYDV